MQLDFDNKLRKNTPFNIQKVKAAYDFNDHIVGRTLKESLIEVLFIYQKPNKKASPVVQRRAGSITEIIW